jgi:iron complex outermembrane receptor protein
MDINHHHRLHLARWCVPAVVALLNGPLTAQVATDTNGVPPRDTLALPPDSSRARTLETIVVTGDRAPASLGGAGAVMLNPASLRVPPAPSLEQVLRELPFVLVRQNSRGETELSLRGSDSRQVAVMLDGIPLTLGWDHRSDPSLVPLTGVQHLVLVRGLSSLLHGPNVLGGIVEVGAAAHALGSRPVPELKTGIGVGDYGTRSVSIVSGAPVHSGSGILSLRGGFGYRTRSGVPISGDLHDPSASAGLRANSDLDQVDGFAAVRWHSELGRYVGFTATGYSAERGVPPELHVSEPRFWRYPSVSRRLAILSAGTGPAGTPLGFGSVELAAGASFGSSELEDFENAAYETVVGRETGDERTLSVRTHGRHSLPGYGELRGAFTGAEVRYDEQLDNTTPNRYRQRLGSIGFEAQWPLLRDGLVGGGIAYDRATTPETGGKPSLGTMSAWGWRLGATSPELGDGVQLHTSLSQRARFPALRELYSGALNRFEPNPDLKPERLLGGEVGATFIYGLQYGSGLNLQAVAFHHRLADAIVREATGDGRFRRVSRHAILSTGLELLASWSAPSGLSLTGDLLIQRVRQHDPSAGTRPAEHQPELRGRLGAEVPLGIGVRLLTDLRYTGSQYCVHPDLGTEVALGGGAEGDIALEKTWALQDHGMTGGVLSAVRAMIGVDNVNDATMYDQCGLPRPGRALRLALQLL